MVSEPKLITLEIARLTKLYLKAVYRGTGPGEVKDGPLGTRVYPSFGGFYEWLKERLVDGK